MRQQHAAGLPCAGCSAAQLLGCSAVRLQMLPVGWTAASPWLMYDGVACSADSPTSPGFPCCAAMSFQCFFLGFLILAPRGPVAEEFAGLLPFPADFRGKLCLLLFANLAASWVGDSGSSWLYHRLKGRRLPCCGLLVS